MFHAMTFNLYFSAQTKTTTKQRLRRMPPPPPPPPPPAPPAPPERINFDVVRTTKVPSTPPIEGAVPTRKPKRFLPPPPPPPPPPPVPPASLIEDPVVTTPMPSTQEPTTTPEPGKLIILLLIYTNMAKIKLFQLYQPMHQLNWLLL